MIMVHPSNTLNEIRACPKCKKSYLYTSSYFYKNHKSKSGLENICKKCRKQINVEWNKANPEKRRNINRRHYPKKYQVNKSWRKEQKTFKQCQALNKHTGKRCTFKLPQGFRKRCPHCVEQGNPILKDIKDIGILTVFEIEQLI